MVMRPPGSAVNVTVAGFGGGGGGWMFFGVELGGGAGGDGGGALQLSTLADILFRDRQDTTRLIDPLVPAADAFILDTTELTVDEVSAVMFHLVTACRSRG